MRSWSDEDLTKAVYESYNMCEVLSKIGIRFGGGSFQIIKKHILRLKLNTSHFKRKPRSITKYPIGDVFIEHCKMASSAFRRKVLKLKIIPYICEECSNSGEYLGRPLSLQLDHKNGIHNDNRIENLRWLCPNCHSQTSTYSKTKGKLLLFTERQPNVICDGCGTSFWRKPSTIKLRRDRGHKIYCTHACSILHRSSNGAANQNRTDFSELEIPGTSKYTMAALI